MAGFYYCSASYANSELLQSQVEVKTYGEKDWSYGANCLYFISLSQLVAITWKDAPEEQSSITGKDYLVRCEVKADPPATVGNNW